MRCRFPVVVSLMRMALVLAACGTPASPHAPDLATLGAAGLHAIDPTKLEAATKFLSSDALAGREPGSEGDTRAEQYIADQFAALGLEPAGERHTYFQTVPLRVARRIDAETSLIVQTARGEVAFAQGVDALILGEPHAASVAIDAPLVFVGYGLAVPGYDDLAGVELHGAIAVVFAGAPRSIGGRAVGPAEHAVLSDLKQRSIVLAAHGARAILAIYDPVRGERMAFDQWVPKIVGPQMAWLDPRGTVGSKPVLPTVVITEAAIDKILDGKRIHGVWAALDHGEHARLALDATASLRIHSELRDVRARNVLGLLRGSDPALAAETIVYTAHHDHLGIGPPVDGDAIYNGALDDAIGCAGIIEIARGFEALAHRPRRSILFLAVTGEEKGLLGSDYFATYPTIPLGQLVADINIDGLGAQWEPFDITALGSEHSSLAGDVADAAHAMGLVVSEDPEPEQVYFIRSDQYSFVQRHVPSVFPGAGYRDAHGRSDTNRAINDAWSIQHYHRPSDVWRPEYRATWAAKEAGFDFLVGLSVANATNRPRWNAGDVFADPSVGNHHVP